VSLSREDSRQLLHVGTTLLAIPLRWLTPGQAIVMACVGVALGWFVFPRLGVDAAIRRENSPWLDGVQLYPVAVLAVVVLFPLPAAAAAWAILGFGDAASNVIGRRFGRPGFLGRKDRSAAGTAAFLVAAAPAAVVAHLWVADAAPTSAVLVAAGIASAAGAIVELLMPPRWDDNLAIAVVAGAVFTWFAANPL
jgi:dolichol kinase